MRDEILDWSIGPEDDLVSYLAGFIEMRNTAIEEQKKHRKGSIIYQQYQTFIDVGNEMIDLSNKDYQDE